MDNLQKLPEAHAIFKPSTLCAGSLRPPWPLNRKRLFTPMMGRYIDLRECQPSYNPTLMALLWEAAATRETRLLAQSLNHGRCC